MAFAIFKHKAPVVQVRGAGRREIFPGLRRGMWVMHQGKIGILHDKQELPSGEVRAEVHYVHINDGTTTSVILVNPAELRQADHYEIPAIRRPEEAHSARLGYKR